MQEEGGRRGPPSVAGMAALGLAQPRGRVALGSPPRALSTPTGVQCSVGCGVLRLLPAARGAVPHQQH